MALEQNPEADCDLVGHGWCWIDYQDAPKAVERDHIRRTAETVARLTGEASLGWCTGRPGRIASLARFLDHVVKHDQVWICQRGAIARHWIERHPYAG